MTLFEIGDDLRALSSLLDESEGEITPESEEAYARWFAELGDNQAAKLDGYVGLQKQWEGEAAVVQSVLDQFGMKLQTLQNRIKRHKQRMLEHMLATRQTKAKTASGWEIAVQKNGGKTPINTDDGIDPKTLPKQFQKVTFSIDSDAVRESLEAGEQLPFARLLERGVHLRVR